MHSNYIELQKFCSENDISVQYVCDSYFISSKIHKPLILTLKVLLKNFGVIENYFINELEHANYISNYYRKLLDTKENISKSDSSIEEYMFWYFDSFSKDRLIFKDSLCFYNDLKLLS